MYDLINLVAPQEGPQKKTLDEAQAWRVQYRSSKDAAGAGVQICLIREPEPMLATAESIALALALKEPRAAEGDSAFTIIWVPSSSASTQLEEEVESWLGNPDEREIVRAGIRTVRVAWTSDRCIIYAPAEKIADAMDAVLRFTPAKRQSTSLERRMLDVWSDLDGDVPLSHGIAFWRARRRRINERTERVTRMHAERLRLQKALEQLDIKLTSASKRLYAELVLQATIYDRLEVIEDPIVFAMDHYELAVTRLTEARNALMDHWFEAAIILLLVAQVVVEIASRA